MLCYSYFADISKKHRCSVQFRGVKLGTDKKDKFWRVSKYGALSIKRGVCHCLFMVDDCYQIVVILSCRRRTSWTGLFDKLHPSSQSNAYIYVKCVFLFIALKQTYLLVTIIYQIIIDSISLLFVTVSWIQTDFDWFVLLMFCVSVS